MPKYAAILAGILIASGAMASAASAKTIKLYSKSASEVLYNRKGKVVTDKNKLPKVGYRYYATNVDYRGNHRNHSRQPVGFDHMGCLVTDVSNIDSFDTICDAQWALPGGMIVVDMSPTSPFAGSAVYDITGGLGKYRKAKGGKIVTRTVGNGNSTDVTIKY